MGLFDLFRKRDQLSALETPIREVEQPANHHKQALKAALALAKFGDHILITYTTPAEITPERDHEFVHSLIIAEMLTDYLLSDKFSTYLAEKVHASVRARLSGAKLKLESVLENEDQIVAHDQEALRLVAMIAHLADTVHCVLYGHPDYAFDARD